MDWVRILFLAVMLSVSVSQAAETSLQSKQQSQNPSHDPLDYPLITLTNLKLSELKFASAAAEQSDKSAEIPSKEQTPKSGRECGVLTYEVTLFKPCAGENGKRLWQQTKVVFVGGFAVMGVIAMLPEEISKWDRSEIGKGQLIEKWWDNVRAGPVWDDDVWFINYIGHPYFGGVYYQAARKSGYNQWNSFTYSALMSTFYWEYGVEAFAEVPSLQDLVVTPVGGWIYGEWAHRKEQQIRNRGGTAFGSKFWGNISLFLLDPLGSIDTWVRKNSNRKIQEPVFHVTHKPGIATSDGTYVKYDHWELKLAFKF